MTDYKQLCAELLDWTRLLIEIPDPPVTRCADDLTDLLARTRAALSEPEPEGPTLVPVSERLPGPEDCIPHPRTKLGKWCWGFERCEVSLARPARWRLMHLETIELEASHWCEAHALPLPNNTSRSN